MQQQPPASLTDPFDIRPTASRPRLNILPEHEEELDAGAAVKRGRFPSWLHRRLPEGGGASGYTRACGA